MGCGEGAFQEGENLCALGELMAYVQNPGPRRAPCVPAEERDSPGGAQRAWEADATCPHTCGRALPCHSTGGPGGRGARWGSAHVGMRGWARHAHLRLSQHCLLSGSTLVQKKYLKRKKKNKTPHSAGTSLAVQWLRPQLMMQGVRVWSQGGKLRSHMTHGPKNQNIKQKQNCNKLNKDFNSGGWVSRLFLAVATPWTVAGQDPLPTAFPRPEYWSGLPFCSSGNLPDPRIELNVSCTAGRFFTTGAREDRWSTSKNL